MDLAKTYYSSSLFDERQSMELLRDSKKKVSPKQKVKTVFTFFTLLN